MDKPQHTSGYSTASTESIKSVCLLVATRLHDLMPHVRIFGGLVPTLIVGPQNETDWEAHVGTLDLDLGLQATVLDGSQYQEISARLRNAGFSNDESTSGTKIRQRWVHPSGNTIDFLIPFVDDGSLPGSLQNLEQDFAAIKTLGLELAFLDSVEMELSGKLPGGDEATRQIWVCGPGAFVILKALAFRNRAEPKDAYDLHFVLRYWGEGLDDLVNRVCSLPPNDAITIAIKYLKEDFQSVDSIGVGSVDTFLSGEGNYDEVLRADVSGIVMEFCRQMERCLASS